MVALACDVAYSDYALGFTKLFLRAGKGVFLEELLAMDITEVIPLLEQKIREREKRQKAIKTVGYCVLGWYRRVRLKKQKGAARTNGRWWRGGIARKNCRKLAKAREGAGGEGVARPRRRRFARRPRSWTRAPRRRRRRWWRR